jgi:hypothetical protein
VEYIDINAVGPKVLAAWALILALGWYTFDQTKRFFFATFLTLGLLFFSARVSGVISEHHMEKMSDAAGGKIDSASHRARMIGDKRHKTSAGQAGGTSKHYKKHVEGAELER